MKRTTIRVGDRTINERGGGLRAMKDRLEQRLAEEDEHDECPRRIRRPEDMTYLDTRVAAAFAERGVA